MIALKFIQKKTYKQKTRLIEIIISIGNILERVYTELIKNNTRLQQVFLLV